MGITNQRDAFSPKYITAIIKDSSGRGHIRAIKHVIGDYWITDIDHQTYIFKIVESRIITYKETAARACRILFYSTSHYRPISPEDNRNMEMILKTNDLPRMNVMMFGAFKLLSQREKKEKIVSAGKTVYGSTELTLQKEHIMDDIFKNVAKSAGDKYATQAQNLKTYFENMAVDKIITPVREVTEFIEDDLIETDPKFLGDIYQALQRTDFEHKKVTNAKVDAKKNWMVLIAIFAIVGAMGFLGFYLISNGSGGGLSIPGLNFPTTTTGGGTSSSGQPTATTGKLTDAQVFAQYPTPQKLYDAVQNGQISKDQLSPTMIKLLNSYHPPPQAIAH